MIGRLLIAFVVAAALSAGARVHAAARAVVEGDLVQRDGDRLCTLSPWGSLGVVDVSRPDALVALGQVVLPLPGTPRRFLSGKSFALALSDSNLRSYVLTPFNAATSARDLITGTCVLPTTDGLFPESSSVHDGCMTAPGRARPLSLSCWPTGLAAVLVLLARRRWR